MKIKYRILTLYACIFIAWIIFGSNASNPPNGHTNAPFDQYCTRCHGASSAFNGTVEISGIPAMVDAGQSYSATLTITATQGSPVRGGFQLVSVFSPGNDNAGDISTSGTDVGTSTSGGREYLEHRGAKNFNGGTVSWDFEWTAPDGPDGATITMYYAGNLTNGNGGSNGDRPVSGSSSFILSADSAPLVAGISNQINVSCNGENDGSASADPSGGTPPYAYEWSNGATTATVSALSAGNYDVTISDAGSNTATASVSISEPTLLVSSVMGNDIDCNGSSSGSATANPSGGTSPYRYSWSNGRTSKTINDLAAGSYEVTVTDNNDCTTSAIVVIAEPDALTLMMSATDETAANAEDGTATASASGGTEPYSYEWSNGATTMSVNNLAAGTYLVTATDANQCTEIGMVTIQGMECSLQVNVNATDASCFGDSTGSAEVTVAGAQNPVEFIWSDGQTTAIAQNLAAGIYEVTITDANGCETMAAAMIDQPNRIEVVYNTSAPTCPDMADGQIMVSIEGGSSPYEMVWSDTSIANNPNQVAAGTYSLTITDANGCTVESSLDLLAVDTTAPLLISQGGSVYLDSTGSVFVPLELPVLSATDKCGIDSIWSIPALMDCSLLGDQEVVFVAMDASGNINQDTAIIQVIDSIRPIFLSCVEDIEADSGTVIEYEMPVAFDNCGIDSFALTEGLPSGSIFPSGETKVSYMAIDASGNYECCSFFVRIGGTVATIDEAFSQQINVYPNPVTSNLKIELPSGNQKTQIIIYDSMGNQIKAISLKENDRDFSDLSMLDFPAGIYLFGIIQGEKIAMRKIIKN